MTPLDPTPPAPFDAQCLPQHVITRYRTRSGATVEITRDGTGRFGFNIQAGDFASAGSACRSEESASEAAWVVLRMRGLV